MIIQTQLDCADGGTEVTVKQIPLYEQIYEEIRAKIEERGYQVGDRLPSEKELSEQYHVSRITSKKAVELLAEEGLVTRIPGKGTFVIEHQETPKALEVPAGSIAEKKTSFGSYACNRCCAGRIRGGFWMPDAWKYRNGMPESGFWDDADLLLWKKRRRSSRD